MVLMKYFFFCFPVRLGVIISSGLVIIENLVLLGVLLTYSEIDINKKAEKIKEEVEELSSFDYFDQFLDYVTKDTMNFRWISIGVLGACLIACVVNIISALTQYRWLSVPYILIRFFEIFVILAMHITYMMLMKQEWNLGILILACCIGGFGILFLFYLWAVTVAMFQMIGVVNSKDYQERLSYESTLVKNQKNSLKNISIATIAPTVNRSRELPPQMFESDFSEVYRKNYRKI